MLIIDDVQLPLFSWEMYCA